MAFGSISINSDYEGKLGYILYLQIKYLYRVENAINT